MSEYGETPFAGSEGHDGVSGYAYMYSCLVPNQGILEGLVIVEYTPRSASFGTSLRGITRVVQAEKQEGSWCAFFSNLFFFGTHDALTGNYRSLPRLNLPSVIHDYDGSGEERYCIPFSQLALSPGRRELSDTIVERLQLVDDPLSITRALESIEQLPKSKNERKKFLDKFPVALQHYVLRDGQQSTTYANKTHIVEPRPCAQDRHTQGLDSIELALRRELAECSEEELAHARRSVNDFYSDDCDDEDLDGDEAPLATGRIIIADRPLRQPSTIFNPFM